MKKCWLRLSLHVNPSCLLSLHVNPSHCIFKSDNEQRLRATAHECFFLNPGIKKTITTGNVYKPLGNIFKIWPHRYQYFIQYAMNG